MHSSTIFRLVLTSLILALCFNVDAFAKKHTLLIALTHGDDVAAIAPLLMKYSAEGHSIYYAVFPGLQTAASYEPGGASKQDLDCGARAMGIKETFILGGTVAGDGDANQKAIAQRLIEIINQTNPDVITTWGPDGLTGHGKHIMVGNVVTRVFQQQRLLKYKPRKLYYIAYPESLFPETRMPIGQIADTTGPFGTVSDAFITTRIDGSRYLNQIPEAIGCFTTTQEDNQKWQKEWKDRLVKTLGGTVYLRLVIPAGARDETDIFKRL